MGGFLVPFCHARQVTRRWLNKSRMLWILSIFCKALQAYLWPTFQVTKQWLRAPKPQRCNLVKPTRSTVFLLFVSPKELVQNVSHRSLTSSGRSSEWKRKKKALSYSDPQGQECTVSRNSYMNSMWGSPISGSPGYGQPSSPTDPVYRLEPQQQAPSHQQCRTDLGKSRDLAITNNALLKWNTELYLQTTLLKEDMSLGWGQSKNCYVVKFKKPTNISFCPLPGSWDKYQADEGMIHRTLLDAEIALVLSPTC